MDDASLKGLRNKHVGSSDVVVRRSVPLCRGANRMGFSL